MDCFINSVNSMQFYVVFISPDRFPKPVRAGSYATFTANISRIYLSANYWRQSTRLVRVIY